jgi:hypothetical protein
MGISRKSSLTGFATLALAASGKPTSSRRSSLTSPVHNVPRNYSEV